VSRGAPISDDEVISLASQLAKTNDTSKLAKILSKLEKLGEAASPAAASVIAVLLHDYSIGEQGRAAIRGDRQRRSTTSTSSRETQAASGIESHRSSTS
jgi:hypothetical protein